MQCKFPYVAWRDSNMTFDIRHIIKLASHPQILRLIRIGKLFEYPIRYTSILGFIDLYNALSVTEIDLIYSNTFADVTFCSVHICEANCDIPKISPNRNIK